MDEQTFEPATYELDVLRPIYFAVFSGYGVSLSPPVLDALVSVHSNPLSRKVAVYQQVIDYRLQRSIVDSIDMTDRLVCIINDQYIKNIASRTLSLSGRPLQVRVMRDNSPIATAP